MFPAARAAREASRLGRLRKEEKEKRRNFASSSSSSPDAAAALAEAEAAVSVAISWAIDAMMRPIGLAVVAALVLR